jgi:hypothetical protein
MKLSFTKSSFSYLFIGFTHPFIQCDFFKTVVGVHSFFKIVYMQTFFLPFIQGSNETIDVPG